MIYLYGLLEPRNGAAAGAAIAGIDGVTGPVHTAPCGPYTLLHGDHDGAEILPRRRALLGHARVLEAAMTAGTVLPMRFGMTCASVADFADLASAREAEINGALDRLRGHAELGLRVTAAERAALDATLAASPALAAARDRLAAPGGSNHFAKVEFGRALGEAAAGRRARAQKALLGALAPLAAAHVLKAPETDFEPLRAEFLLPEAEIPAFTTAVEEAVAQLDFAGPDGCSARIVGPGPAFHFVDLALVPPGAEAAA